MCGEEEVRRGVEGVACCTVLCCAVLCVWTLVWCVFFNLHHLSIKRLFCGFREKKKVANGEGIT